MLKKTVTFFDDDGQEITKNCYFSLTQAEIVDDEFGGNSGESFVTILRKMTNEKDPSKIIAFVKKIMLASYGERTPDGGFIKNQTIRDKFAASPEYSELFFEIVQSTEAVSDFVNGIVPKAMVKQAEKLQKQNSSKMNKSLDEFIKTGEYSALNEAVGAGNVAENPNTQK